ncbi:MAG: T9SS type A sorting domain-containing protein [candidate division KSB1 bacterium]|nr:T9SS type A sorting domain-containing protein [candidate division KSB1 bacterium]
MILFIDCTMNLLAQTVWKQVINRPVLSFGAAGKWDDGAVLWPTVIKDGDTLRMWYAGSDEILGLGSVQIGYAWSLNGISWIRYAGNPVLSAELFWEARAVVCPAVIKDGKTLKMWYGANGIPPRLIGYATSTNGIHWNKHPEPVLELGPRGDWDDSIMGPGTVIKEKEVYKLWYWGGRENWPVSKIQVGLAISPDGINWIKHDEASTVVAPFSSSDPVLKVGEAGEWDQLRVWSPAILATGTGYEMWYAGRAGYTTPPQLVGYAVSSDGIAWKKSPNNPVISERPEWGFSYLTSAVLEFNGFYHLWFTSFPFANDGQRAEIGYARSVSDSSAIKEIPASYLLSPNHPNPFKKATTFQYALPERAEVALVIYDLLGKRVKTLVQGGEEAGFKSVAWDGTDELGRPVSAGVYLYRIHAGGFIQTRKMVLLER